MINFQLAFPPGNFLPGSHKRSSIFGKFPQPEMPSFLAIISHEEVLNPFDSTKLIQQFQAILSNDDIGASNNNDQMRTTTLTMKRTGDQMIEEAKNHYQKCSNQPFFSSNCQNIIILKGEPK